MKPISNLVIATVWISSAPVLGNPPCGVENSPSLSSEQKSRISAASAGMFLDGAVDAKENAKKAPLEKQAAVVSCHERSIQFWKKRLAEANAE